MTKSTSRSGTAVIRLRDGRQYEGDVHITGPWVHFTGRRRVSFGDYRAADDHSWPHRNVEFIRWLEAAV